MIKNSLWRGGGMPCGDPPPAEARAPGRAFAGGARWAPLGVALALAALGGCAAKRTAYDVPLVPVPPVFQQHQQQNPRQNPQPTQPPAAAEAARPGARALDQVLPQWWRTLGSAELDGLVARALERNPDLRMATLRVRQARARAEQAVSDQLPVVTGTLQQRREAAAGDVGGGVTSGRTPARTVSQAGLRADLRVDVWGERQAMAESADMQQRRAALQRDDVQRNLVASVVGAYLDYLSFNDRVQVARETDIAVSDMLAAVEVRLDKGDATVIDMEQQRAAVYAVKATIPALEQQRDEALNNLSVLLGAAPGALKLEAKGLASLSFPAVTPGVPSALLLRRPDIRVMEARLLAADADLDVARTRLLPSLDLSAQAGYGSQHFSRLFEPQTLFWNLVASLTATIFDHGRRDREVDFANAVHEELVEGYARVIYGAVREVDDALNAIRLSRQRLDAQREAAQASRRAWDYSRESYQAGAIDHLLLLDTERTYHRNLDEQHNIDLQRYRGLVNLFTALGGGVADAAPLPGRGKRPQSAAQGGEVASGPAQPAVGAAAAPGQGSAAQVPALAPASAPVQAQAQAPAQAQAQAQAGAGWQLELASVADAAAVARAWRDLLQRFPDLMAQRQLLSRTQPGGGAGLRVFVAGFASGAEAEIACARLREQRIQCQAVAPGAAPAAPPLATASPPGWLSRVAARAGAAGMARP
ncbi:efflux transporter outer membrane subunit [Pseudoduganella namucuonensis]|uniref:Efflux transporter, outer membrane factor (OMF) lipoprotein, NodT family n=1 Tax=Pseudoduganella namucuonensis TaxID=1035707 RepID=A0A1I7KYC6_9BURK|nr:efflux transporter outer membrane subunit [Pseudoduganella namucuonensis]SFV02415.1 efflux transporter, outer membrane factor (OMF) lipoprotein, NodT family [Pseudoduganella namucuonensis]